LKVQNHSRNQRKGPPKKTFFVREVHTGAWLLIRRFGRITLFDIVGLHNSIVHLNCPPGQKYAPIAIQQDLIEDFVEHIMQAASATAAVGLAEAEVMVPLHNMARSRVRHDKLSKSLDGIHANAVHGELAGILGIWGRTVDGKLGPRFRGCAPSLVCC
jgi:hypothetical protein